jgi:hypothetical protein
VTLDVITEHFTMTLGASFSESFASLTIASHFQIIGEEAPRKTSDRVKGN